MSVKKIFKQSVLFAVTAVFSFAMSPSLSSAVEYVALNGDNTNGDSWATAYNTIQAAIDDADDGEEIWVKAGTYSGTVFMTQNVLIYGGFPASGTPGFGDRDWVTNVTTVDGGGTSRCFYIRYNDATIDGFTITNGSDDGDGGGIYIRDNATLHHENTLITNCIFTGNDATSGGALYISGSSPTISNCIFYGNNATFGGASFNTGGYSPNIIHCTFSDNEALTHGGAMANNGSNPVVTNCILWGNTYPGGDTELYNTGGANPTVRYSDIEGCGGSALWDSSYGTDGGGNIDDDPDFVGGGNYKLVTDPQSPCIDAGTDEGVTTDIEGIARPQDLGYDMGAYEMIVGCTTNDDCDDGQYCNGEETCDVDTCQAGTDPCPGQMCRESDDTCVECLDDSDCDDGSFCNGAETCDGSGTCQPGTDPCPGEMCRESDDQCVECLIDADCDDGGDCTTDTCDGAGICQNVPLADGTGCEDGLYCTDGDTCLGGVCQGGPARDCSAFTDQCNDGVCDEDNDTCVAQPVSNGTPCDDTLFCTQTDQCTDGTCIGSGDPCPGEMCNEIIDQCVECLEDTDCDDSNPCTDEICDTDIDNGTCVYTNNTDPCDDGLFCTDNDTCSGGACISGDPMDCSAFTDQCNDGICDESGDACIAQPVTNGTPCDDGLFCTETDQCTDGTCVGSGDPCPIEERCDEDLDECVNCIDDIDCDDANDCTDDVCNAGTCEYTNNSDPCDDGLFCTTSDQCTDGTCTGDDTCPGQLCDEINEVCYDHVLTVNIIGNGDVSLDPAPETADGKYDNGTDVELTAIPDPDNIFAGWGVDLTGFINPENITMDSDKIITAKFVAYEIVDNATDITLDAKDPSELPDNATDNIPDMVPYGLIEVEITGVPDNGTTVFKFTLPAPAPPGFTWQKCTEATGCIDFSRDVISGGTGDGAVISDNRTEVTVYITDNGPYDLDNTLSIVKDPSGLAGECILDSDCSAGFECSAAGTCVRSSSGGPSGGGGGGGGAPPAPECELHSDCEDGYCDTEQGGVCVECLTDINCDNGLFCDGQEKCVNTVCVAGTDPCSEDETCDEENDVCIPLVTPECEQDSDCDNGIFCDGIETCEDGLCADGENSCEEDEICMEGVDACWGIEKLTALSLQKAMFKPIILNRRCPWLAIKPEAPNNFSANSTLSITGPDETAQGVEIDSTRETVEFLGYILVPVCIDKNATEGEWTLQIESDVDDPTDPFMEVIEYSFEIR